MVWMVGMVWRWRGCAGVGGHIIAVVSPTNVSLENVWLQEEACEPFVSGWFVDNNFIVPHDNNAGAFSPKRIAYMPTYGCIVSDYLDSGNFTTWGEGELTWEIPVKWWIVAATRRFL